MEKKGFGVRERRKDTDMRLSDDFEDKNTGLPLIYMGVGVALFAVTVIGAVVLGNRTPGENKNTETKVVETKAYEAETETEDFPADADAGLISGSKRTSDELDFWHMYDEEAGNEKEPAAEKEKEEEEKNDPSTDGKHTRLVSEDGTEEWVSINPYLTKHTYDFSGLVYQYPIMKYYEDSQKVSKVGIFVSQESGDVNFSKVKKAGVDFAMIRIGYRGYGSGNLMADEMFYENVREASQAGLDIGVTFYSQAVTKEEALEEASRVIEGLQGFSIVYPVVYDMEYVKNDTARVEGLSKEDKTEIALTFLQAVENAGFQGMVYGEKEWLIRKVDLSKLIGYDIWLSQEEDAPDYPYKFTMWEYGKSIRIDGAGEPARLSICFIDYAAK